MEKNTITEAEAKTFVKEFIDEINNQDNRSTASPYFYVIRSAIWVPSYHEDEGERFVYVNNHDPEDQIVVTYQCDIIETFKKDNEHDETYDGWSDEKIEEYIDDNYSCFSENKKWEERNCFLTESEAENHLKANHYHYSHDAHTYVKHFWRAPKIKKFFEAVAIMVGTEFTKH